eukprot:scaffold80644_cov34-Phaeocystis_antarctica.AAC.1
MKASPSSIRKHTPALAPAKGRRSRQADPRDQAMRRSVWREKSARRGRRAGYYIRRPSGQGVLAKPTVAKFSIVDF